MRSAKRFYPLFFPCSYHLSHRTRRTRSWERYSSSARPSWRKPRGCGSTDNMSATSKSSRTTRKFYFSRRTSDFRAPVRVHGFHSEGGCGAGEKGRLACDNAEKILEPNFPQSHLNSSSKSHRKGQLFSWTAVLWEPSMNLVGLDEGCW